MDDTAELIDDLTGSTGETIRRAIRRFVEHLPEPQCGHTGVHRFGALDTAGTWCGPCAYSAGLADLWATVPVCMGCGRWLGDDRTLATFPVLDLATVAMTICSGCVLDLKAMKYENNRRTP